MKRSGDRNYSIDNELESIYENMYGFPQPPKNNRAVQQTNVKSPVYPQNTNNVNTYPQQGQPVQGQQQTRPVQGQPVQQQGQPQQQPQQQPQGQVQQGQQGQQQTAPQNQQAVKQLQIQIANLQAQLNKLMGGA